MREDRRSQRFGCTLVGALRLSNHFSGILLVVVDEFVIANPPTAETKQPCVSRETGTIRPIVGADGTNRESTARLCGDAKAGAPMNSD